MRALKNINFDQVSPAQAKVAMADMINPHFCSMEFKVALVYLAFAAVYFMSLKKAHAAQTMLDDKQDEIEYHPGTYSNLNLSQVSVASSPSNNNYAPRVYLPSEVPGEVMPPMGENASGSIKAQNSML